MESYSVGLYSSCEIHRHGEVNSIQNCMIRVWLWLVAVMYFAWGLWCHPPIKRTTTIELKHYWKLCYTHITLYGSKLMIPKMFFVFQLGKCSVMVSCKPRHRSTVSFNLVWILNTWMSFKQKKREYIRKCFCVDYTILELFNKHLTL